MSSMVRIKIRTYIKDLLRSRGDTAAFDDGELLFSRGRLNSLDATDTVIFLEDNFGIDFARIGFDQALVDSVDAMTNLVERSATRS